MSSAQQRAAGIERRADIIDAIAMLTATNGYAPSVRELGAEVGLRSTSSVKFHLKALESYGMVTSEREGPRTVRLTPGGMAAARIYWLTEASTA